MQKIAFLILTFLTLLFTTTPALALQQSGQTVTLPSSQTVNEDYFATGSNITLSGTINGDAYLAGGNITVDGTVNGDLLTAGGNINISGNVTGNIRAAGGQVNITSTVGRNIGVAGGTINVSPKSQVTGSMAIAGGSVNIAGPVGRDINAGAGELYIDNKVGGNVNAAGQITLGPSANIAGNLTYLSNIPAKIESQASVSGTITQNKPPERQAEKPGLFPAILAFNLFTSLAFLVSYLVVGLLLLRFTPAILNGAVEKLNLRFWGSLGIGFLTIIITPILILILFVTLFGIPLALILAALFALSIFLSQVIVSLFLGQKVVAVLNTKTNSGWTLFIGIIIYTILTLIPIFGGLICFAAILLGLGALIISRPKL